MGRAALIAALLLMAGSVLAGQDDPRLPDLFDQLRTAPSQGEGRAIEEMIWRVWLLGGDEDSNLLMKQGVLYMSRGELPLALAAFNGVVSHEPKLAEGWNKRATVYFLMGDFASSVEDIERTLALEPRHFGALSGLGQIYLALDKKAAALKAFDAALAINPHMPSVKEAAEDLRKELAGKPL
jgi:tetratricopeptide (TPR) repeat protein